MILTVWVVVSFFILSIVRVRFFILVFVFVFFWYFSGSAASSVVVDLGFCGVSMIDLRSAGRRRLRANTTPSSVRTKWSSVRSLFPNHTPDFHLSSNFGARFPDPFQPLEDTRTVPPNSTSFSSIMSAQNTIERRLHITTSEAKDEPSCMSNNPSHQGAVGGWSVMCALLHCCQHCTHLSLQLFLIVSTHRFLCCDRLGELRMTVLSDLLDLAFSAHLMSDGSGSQCRMMSESPRKFNIFDCPHCCERVCYALHFYKCGHAVPKYSQIHAEHVQSTCALNVFEHEIVTLSH